MSRFIEDDPKTLEHILSPQYPRHFVTLGKNYRNRSEGEIANHHVNPMAESIGFVASCAPYRNLGSGSHLEPKDLGVSPREEAYGGSGIHHEDCRYYSPIGLKPCVYHGNSFDLPIGSESDAVGNHQFHNRYTTVSPFGTVRSQMWS